MRAINHALTGAMLGLTLHEPLLAAPLAFLSHFAQDALPHYDPPGDEATRLRNGDKLLVFDAIACVLLVALLAVTRPAHWVLAALCAFLATSPDLFWIPKFIQMKRSNTLKANTNVFWRFHHWIQWRTGPGLLWVEVIWAIVLSSLIGTQL